MLTIRREQMEVLLEQRRIQLLVSHARQFFPEKSATVTRPDLEDTARSAIKRARSYGLTSVRDAMQFLDLMFVLGPDFDVKLPWANEILSDRSSESTRFRSTRLYLKAVRHLRSQA